MKWGVDIRTGDCRALLAEMPAGSVDCCVTSPPYWGLRDYGHPGQIGQEATPADYVATLVEVFRGVRQAMRDDGTLWLNLGDSYFGSLGNYGGQCDQQAYTGLEQWRPPTAGKMEGLKAKDLVGIPWRVAFALQADGWYLRQDIIWHKPNPMPESVTDRCTKAHEYLFLLSKSARYYFDHEAIQEEAVCGWNDSEFDTGKTAEHLQGRAQKRESRERGSFNGKTQAMPGREAFRAIVNRRNKRSVWTVATNPYAGAHFATFPPELIVPCILAGSRPGGTVLDPFGGSGTTGMVALEYGRRAVLLELNPEYVKLAEQRTLVTPQLAFEGARQAGLEAGAPGRGDSL